MCALEGEVLPFLQARRLRKLPCTALEGMCRLAKDASASLSSRFSSSSLHNLQTTPQLRGEVVGVLVGVRSWDAGRQQVGEGKCSHAVAWK